MHFFFSRQILSSEQRIAEEPFEISDVDQKSMKRSCWLSEQQVI